MILLWIYLAGILPAMLVSAYVEARTGGGVSHSARLGLRLGAIWPMALLVAPLVLALDQAAKLGKRQREARASAEVAP